MKFKTKIFSYIFISTALIICGMSIIMYVWISDRNKQTCLNFEKELASLTALKTEDYILRNERVELLRLFQSIQKVDQHIEYIFAEKQGEIIVHTFEKGVPQGLLNLPPVQDASEIDITPVENNQGDLIYHYRVVLTAPAYSLLHVGVSNKKIQADLHSFRILMLIAGCLLLATVPFSVALFLSRIFSNPIHVLRDTIKRIGSGDLQYRLNIKTGDEIEQLVNDINVMAGQLEKSRAGLEQEIAERIHAETALLNQTELLNNILDNVPHSIFWKDRQSVYLGCNKAFAELTGLENTEQIAGKTDYDLPWQNDIAEHIRKTDFDVMDTKHSIHNEEESFLQADGREKIVIVSKVPLHDQKDNVLGVLGIYYDITERKRMEDTLKQTQKMEAIGTLAGGIAHDFNNILGGIIGYTELALNDTRPKTKVYNFLQQVLKSATRAKDLVRQILTFSRKNQEERKAIQLSTIVKEEAKLLRSTLPTTIDILLNIDKKAGMVDADLTQMHQVIMNLCTNAAFAMQEHGGTLKISLSTIMLTQQSSKKYHDAQPGPYIELKISDTGTGIDSRIIHRIFEPFFTTKEKEKGTGMGLAVVHGIVKEHGGNISVKSQINKGTTFTILLPQVLAEDNNSAPPSSAVPRGTGRILFVDDEKTLLSLGKNMLESLGYEVMAFPGSLEALEAFQASPEAFDLIITDYTMPHMTGYTLAERIRKINPFARILLCTGYSDTITPEKAQSAGIKQLLYKPISKKELAETIRNILAKES